MQNKFVQILAYLLSGVSALVFAVYLASSFVVPAKTAVPSLKKQIQVKPVLLAQNTQPQNQPQANPAVSEQTATVVDDAMAAFIEPFIYDTNEGRRNPFRAFQLVDPNANANVVIGPSTPLERYEIGELKLTGILWDIKNPKAMFIDPKNEVHIVSKDDRIGRKRGYIAVIREGEVVVVETTTFSGEPVYSTRVLKIEQ